MLVLVYVFCFLVLSVQKSKSEKRFETLVGVAVMFSFSFVWQTEQCCHDSRNLLCLKELHNVFACKMLGYFVYGINNTSVSMLKILLEICKPVHLITYRFFCTV